MLLHTLTFLLSYDQHCSNRNIVAPVAVIRVHYYHYYYYYYQYYTKVQPYYCLSVVVLCICVSCGTTILNDSGNSTWPPIRTPLKPVLLEVKLTNITVSQGCLSVCCRDHHTYRRHAHNQLFHVV